MKLQILNADTPLGCFIKEKLFPFGRVKEIIYSNDLDIIDPPDIVINLPTFCNGKVIDYEKSPTDEDYKLYSSIRNLEFYDFISSEVYGNKTGKLREEYILAERGDVSVTEAEKYWKEKAKVFFAFKVSFSFKGALFVIPNLFGEFEPNFYSIRYGNSININDFIEARNSDAKAVSLDCAPYETNEYLYFGNLLNVIRKILNRNIDSLIPINIGSGFSVANNDLAESIKNTTNFTGKIKWQKLNNNVSLPLQLDSTLAKDIFNYAPDNYFLSNSFLAQLKKTVNHLEKAKNETVAGYVFADISKIEEEIDKQTKEGLEEALDKLNVSDIPNKKKEQQSVKKTTVPTINFGFFLDRLKGASTTQEVEEVFKRFKQSLALNKEKDLEEFIDLYMCKFVDLYIEKQKQPAELNFDNLSDGYGYSFNVINKEVLNRDFSKYEQPQKVYEHVDKDFDDKFVIDLNGDLVDLKDIDGRDKYIKWILNNIEVASTKNIIKDIKGRLIFGSTKDLENNIYVKSLEKEMVYFKTKAWGEKNRTFDLQETAWEQSKIQYLKTPKTERVAKDIQELEKAKERYVFDFMKTNLLKKFFFMDIYKKQLSSIHQVSDLKILYNHDKQKQNVEKLKNFKTTPLSEFTIEKIESSLRGLGFDVFDYFREKVFETKPIKGLYQDRKDSSFKLKSRRGFISKKDYKNHEQDITTMNKTLVKKPGEK